MGDRDVDAFLDAKLLDERQRLGHVDLDRSVDGRIVRGFPPRHRQPPPARRFRQPPEGLLAHRATSSRDVSFCSIASPVITISPR